MDPVEGVGATLLLDHALCKATETRVQPTAVSHERFFTVSRSRATVYLPASSSPSSALSVPHRSLLSSICCLKSAITSAGFSAPKRAVPATMTFEPGRFHGRGEGERSESRGEKARSRKRWKERSDKEASVIRPGTIPLPSSLRAARETHPLERSTRPCPVRRRRRPGCPFAGSARGARRPWARSAA